MSSVYASMVLLSMDEIGRLKPVLILCFRPSVSDSPATRRCVYVRAHSIQCAYFEIKNVNLGHMKSVVNGGERIETRLPLPTSLCVRELTYV